MRWMNEPERMGSVQVRSERGTVYVDLIQLAQRLDWAYKTDRAQERIRLDLPVHQLIFTAGTPFYYADGHLRQLPFSLLPADDGIYIPLKYLLQLTAQYYPGDLLYDPHRQELLVTPPRFDLLGVRYVVTRNETEVIIPARRVVSYETDAEPDGSFVLIFPQASADTLSFAAAASKGHIKQMQAVPYVEGWKLILTPDSGAVFQRFDFYDDPPLYVVVFKGGEMGATGTLPDIAEKERWSIDLVVIDPGHGGKDPGAVGPNKLYEKTVTLDVGLRLREELERKGIKTIMTRQTDRFVSLGERTKLANRQRGKLFISLHCNSAKDRRAHGSETYFLAPHKNEKAKRVAEFENSVIKLETEEEQRQYSDLDYIILEMAHAQFVKESEQLAGLIQADVSSAIGLSDRGVDQAGFYVLVGASMPAILFEMGFISNYKEEKKLADPHFRQKLAAATAGVILRFLADQERR